MSTSSRGRTGRLARRGAVAGGVMAGAYGTQRLAARRLRRRTDPHATGRGAPAVDVIRDLDSHDGGSIHVIERGSGTPIVFSHGLTLSNQTWVRQFESLPGEGFRVIALDHRGHGESIAGQTGHSIENLARDLRTVLEDLDLHDAVIVGHSMGGIAVQAFAVRYPSVLADRVDGVVLLSTIATTPLADPRVSWLEGAVRKIAGMMPDTSPIWGARNLGLLLARIGFGRNAKPSDVELVRQMIRSCPEATRREAAKAILGVDLTAELARIRVPALVVGGTADVITPPWEARRIASLIPGARCEMLKGGGHMLMLEQPARLNRLIAEFARSVVLVATGSRVTYRDR